MSEDEIYAAIRAAGIARLSRVHAVVLETDGTFSVVPASRDAPADSLRHVSRSRELRSEERVPAKSAQR